MQNQAIEEDIRQNRGQKAEQTHQQQQKPGKSSEFKSFFSNAFKKIESKINEFDHPKRPKEEVHKEEHNPRSTNSSANKTPSKYGASYIDGEEEIEEIIFHHPPTYTSPTTYETIVVTGEDEY